MWITTVHQAAILFILLNGMLGISMNRPCDFLKNNFDLECCPNYGSSDCPITMKEDKECSITKEYLLEIMKYWK
jgi:hypothetical protein